MNHRVVAAIAALAALACQEPQEDAQGLRAEIRDSAGIRIVENERPPDGSRLGWRIGPEPSASIGELEGDEPYMLHEAWAATKLPGGRIVVANRGSGELRVFDAHGTHLATWGGQGEGPGEFVSLSLVAPWPGDSIVAWYSQGGRISIFDSDGNFGRSFSLESADRASWLNTRPLAVRDNGTILAINEAEGADTAIVEIRDGQGALSASLGTHPGREVIIDDRGVGMAGIRAVLYGRWLVTGLWGDLVVASPSNRYEIRAFGADGALARIVRRDHLFRAPTQADLDTYVERRMSSGRGRLPQPVLDDLRESLPSTPLAETFPAFSSVIGDAAGHLWVREYIVSGEEPPAPPFVREYDLPGEARPAQLWTVFDPGGRVLGFIETPGALEIYEIGEDYILGHTTDDLGVEYIQVWPLERSSG